MKPYIPPVIVFASLVGFALLYQYFGFFLIIFGPLLFIPLFLWIGLYAPLLYIPAAHYSGDSNLPFLSVPMLLVYSFLVAVLFAMALSAQSRVRTVGLSLLILLGIFNLFLGSFYFARGGI